MTGNNWEYSNAKYSDMEIRLGQIANEVLGKLYPNIGANVAININLYMFLLKNIDKSDSELAKSITQKNKQIFTAKTIGNIKRKISEQKDLLSIFKKEASFTQKGGKPGVDKTRSGFWDKLFRKLAYPISSRMPPIGTWFFWWIHILYHMEQQKIYGPLISQFLDTITLTLPILSELVESMMPKIFDLLPIPYAGIVGDVIVYFISLIFIFIAVLINNSRQHFGQAFIIALDAIPLLGETLSLAATNLEKGADRYGNYKNRMINSIGDISPTAGNIIYSYTPDVEIHHEPIPSLNIDKIGDEFSEYAEKKSGLTALQDKITDKIDSVTPNAIKKIGGYIKSGIKTRKNKKKYKKLSSSFNI
jgi:hypothetical protein